MTQRLSAVLMLLGGEPTHWCPGCRQIHRINVNKPNEHSKAQWTWNGDVEKPTFNPSINIVGHCHYFIRNGEIEFCGDSAHALKGQKVPLPPIPEPEWEDWKEGWINETPRDRT